MKKLLLLTFLLSSSVHASDFYYKCTNNAPEIQESIELDFNLIQGTWMSIKGLSKYWTHLKLVKVEKQNLIFEVWVAGEGEADFLRANVPPGFVQGQESGLVSITSLLDPDFTIHYSCNRSVEDED